MSGTKVGEVFLDLGFAVDDKTLKNFNSEIQSTVNGMLKLVGLSASAAGFVSIMTGASDTALALRNMTKEFGYSAEGMQRWAAIVHQANPLVSHEQGLNSYLKMAQYIRDMQYGNGDAGTALGMFGGTIEDDSPEKIEKRIRDNLTSVIKNYGVGKASEWIDAITGGVGGINAFQMSDADWESAAAKGKRNAQDDDDLVKMRTAVAGLKEEWDVFIDHIAASFAPALTKIMKASEKGGFWGGVSAIGELDPYNLGAIAPTVIAGSDRVANYIDKHNLLGGNSNESYDYWINRGYSPAQAAAMIAQEKHETGFDPTKIGDTGTAFGAFQWHADRVKKIFEGTGIDVKTANHYKQLQAADWELQHSGLWDKFNELKDKPYDEGAFLSKNWEVAKGLHGADAEADLRGRDADAIAKRITVNAPITIHSTAPAHDVAAHTVTELNRQIINADSQTDTGPAY